MTLNANGGAIILSDGSVSSLEMRFTPDTPVNERSFPTNVVREATDVEPTIVIQVEEMGGSVKTVHVNIPIVALKEVKESDAAVNVTLASSVGEVTLNKAAIADIVDEAGSAESVGVAIEEEPDEVTSAQETALSDEKVRAVYDVSLYVDEKKLENFQTTSKLTIGLPYTLKDGETSESVLVRYVGEDGSTEAMTDGRRYDDAKQLAVFSTKHLSVYAVTYEPVSDGGCDAGFGGGVAVMLSAVLGLCLRRENKR
ncbi:MAG: hypothetical protein LBU13_01040 [Synergistaceae bacterium]|nr:hypothetical protein [Synergistaceae bacterium]